MRNIIIKHDKLEFYEDEELLICDNQIMFKKNGDYVLEYQDCFSVNLDIVVLDDCLVKLLVFGCDNKDIKISTHYSLGSRSNLILFGFYYNFKVNEETVVDLNGEFSKFSLGFSSISKGSLEYHIIVNHNHHHVESNISNKCIGLDGSSIKMQIDSVLEKGNIDCVMDQNTRILTLGDVNAEVIPNMFISEDSVEARHGSVIGGINSEDVFYLMSRGISLEEAVMLLIKGFIFSNLVVDMDKRAKIIQVIQDLRR